MKGQGSPSLGLAVKDRMIVDPGRKAESSHCSMLSSGCSEVDKKGAVGMGGRPLSEE